MRALIVGGSGGIGRSLVDRLSKRDDITEVMGTWYRHPPEPLKKVRWFPLDATSGENVEQLAAETGDLDLLINCIGLLHREDKGPEKTIVHADAEFFLDNIRVNTLPTLLLAKHFMKLLKKSERPVFAAVSARVGSIEENRLGGWYSYRASKAALNMVLKTLAVEWRVKVPNGCVAALHPGTSDTRLSKPFQRNVPPEKLFSTDRTAGQLLSVIDKLTPEKTGRFWSWDGTELPW